MCLLCWFGSSDNRRGPKPGSNWMSCLLSHPEFGQRFSKFVSMRERMYCDLIREETGGGEWKLTPGVTFMGTCQGFLRIVG